MVEQPEFNNVVELIRDVVSKYADKRAFTFMADGETEQSHLTFRELDLQSRKIAVCLQESAAPGDRVILLCPPDLQNLVALVACLYAGMVPVPVFPVHPERPLDAFLRVIADAQPRVILSTSGIQSGLQSVIERTPELRALHWLAMDTLTASGPDAWRQPALYGDTLAAVNYTSGSTMTPRGVMLSHANLLNSIRASQREFTADLADQLVYWFPLYLGSGLLGSLLNACRGASSILMPPTAFIERPVRWLQALSRFRCTAGHGANSSYQLCVDRISAEECQGLDLSRWNTATVGGEPVRAETLNRFAAKFAPYGFRKEAFISAYGLSEISLSICYGPAPVNRTVQRSALEQNRIVSSDPGAPGSVELVSSGTKTMGLTIRIVDPVTSRPRPPDQVGEIWIAGSTVALGYWNRPAETEETFHAYLTDNGEGPFLRTGDMGFMEEGQLYVTGRLKHMLIIHARNFYSQDIEYVAGQAHPALQLGGGAAFSIPADGEERLALVHEIKPGLAEVNVDEIAQAIRRAVGEELQIPVHSIVVVKPASLPRTGIGKIQRHVCRAQFLANQELNPSRIKHQDHPETS